MMRSRRKICFFTTITSVLLLPMISFAKTNPIITTDLLQVLKQGEPWDRGVLTAPKMVLFQKSSGDASQIAQITLAYFTTSTCTGAKAGNNFYTTPINSTAFTIPGTSFGMVAASAWNIGSTKLGISTMTSIRSIAVTFKSTMNNTPQANFSGNSFACIPVTCTSGPSGQCTSGASIQNFILKTTAAVGDPAEGGVIGCKNTGIGPNLYNMVITKNDQVVAWGGSGVSTNATSSTDGAANTTKIVACLTTGGSGVPSSCPKGIVLTTYAAGICSGLSAAGGFTSGWALPSGSTSTSQYNCLYENRAAIQAGGAAFDTNNAYWSSRESDSNNAWIIYFSNGNEVTGAKTTRLNVRCFRAF